MADSWCSQVVRSPEPANERQNFSYSDRWKVGAGLVSSPASCGAGQIQRVNDDKPAVSRVGLSQRRSKDVFAGRCGQSRQRWWALETEVSSASPLLDFTVPPVRRQRAEACALPCQGRWTRHRLPHAPQPRA